MKILMISAEAHPYAKTGGLADAVSSLSYALSKRGHEVRIVLPRYYSINKNSLDLTFQNLAVKTINSEIFCSVYNSGFYYFLDYEKFFGRTGIYGPNPDSEYPDNPLRFATLCRGALEFCSKTNWIPDIVHCHDWSASFASVLLKFNLAGPQFSSTKSVLSIHNLGYQGRYPNQAYSLLGIDENLRFSSGFEQSYGINFLKAGITCADKITTVSPTYAKEIQTSEGGFNLDGLIRVRANSLTGITNGIDDIEWNPETDSKIPFNFSKNNLSNKLKNKIELQKRFNLPQNPDVPVIGIISRLAEQKGIRQLFDSDYGCMKKMLSELNVQFAVVGTGEHWCQEEIHKITGEFNNFGSFIGYNEEVSHLVEAGADFFLMPSQYEPCGLNQLYSMMYGTLPIVRNTGGLADTVIQYNNEGTGTGFKFYDLTPDAIFGTVKWVLEINEQNPQIIKKMRQNAMNQNFSWSESAANYEKIYNS